LLEGYFSIDLNEVLLTIGTSFMRKLAPKDNTVKLEILRGFIGKDKKLFWFTNVLYYFYANIEKDNKENIR
jgi:hypothetical protein